MQRLPCQTAFLLVQYQQERRFLFMVNVCDRAVMKPLLEDRRWSG